jgi:hypothetical protein
MEWVGVDEFLSLTQDIKERMRVGAARNNFEAAKSMRDHAMQNMGAMGIGLVTGRSRALYGAKPHPGAFHSGGSVAAYAGYLDWPSDVIFYPKFLNDGTSRMPSRPYHDLAFEQAAQDFQQGAGRAVIYAFTGRWPV